MNLNRILGPAICIVLCGLMPGSLQANNCSSVDEILWILGNWESRGETSISTESWTRTGEIFLEGKGRSFALPDFSQTFSESIHIAPLAGDLYFTAKVAHNEYPVSFRLTTCSEDSAVFENSEHDFPQRIAYQLEAADKMRVDVSGPDGNGFSVHLNKSHAARRIALTFDDAPRSDSERLTGMERTRLLIESLAKADSPPVIFFSTTRGIDEEGDARMRAYQDAGHYIGNHTHSHRRIDKLGLDGYVADIKAAHEALSGYENFVPLFRFPFLDEGRDEATRDQLRKALKDFGYSNGYVTVDNYDFYIDSLFQKALEQGREVNEEVLGRAYVETLLQAVRFYADVADRYLDTDPAHTLLLHENDLAALFIDDLINALRAEGWTIIDALKAYQDPIAAIEPDTLFNNQGRVAAIAATRGAKRRDLVHPLEDTAQIETMLENSGVWNRNEK